MSLYRDSLRCVVLYEKGTQPRSVGLRTVPVGFDERGQVETIGVILLFGLVLTGALAVVVIGSSALEETQD